MLIKSINFILPLVIYPLDIMVSIAQTDCELRKELIKCGSVWNDIMKCLGDGLYVMTPSNQSLIRIKKYPITPREYGILQHEIFHAVTNIMHRIGMKFIILKSDEAYAYLVQYITEAIYTKMWE